MQAATAKLDLARRSLLRLPFKGDSLMKPLDDRPLDRRS